MQLGQYVMIGGIYIAVFILLHLVETLNKRVYELEKKVIDLRYPRLGKGTEQP